MLRRRRQLAELIPQDRKRRPMLDVVVADPNKVATVLRRGYLAYLIHVQQREISTRMQSWQARRCRNVRSSPPIIVRIRFVRVLTVRNVASRAVSKVIADHAVLILCLR